MRTKYHAFLRRTLCRLGLALAALGGVQVVHAQVPDQYYPAGRNAFDAMGQRINGTSTQFGMHLTGSGVTTTGVTNLSGWTPASNYGVRAPATGPTISIGGKFDGSVGGSKVPMTAVATATRAGVLAAAGRLIPLISTGKALYDLADEIAKASDGMVSPNTTSDGNVDGSAPFKYPNGDCVGGTCYEYTAPWISDFYPSRLAAAEASRNAWAAYFNKSLSGVYCRLVGANLMEFICENETNDPDKHILHVGGLSPRVAQGTIQYKTGNWEDIRPKFEPDTVDLQKLINAQLNAAKRASLTGVDWSIPVTAPVITAPSSLEPTTEKKTRVYQETGPDGITRTKTETTTVTTARPVTVTGDTVKVKPTATTQTQTTTANPDGTTTTETKTETETKESDGPKADESESDLCAKHPDILACSKPELDTPDGEIPKTQKEVKYQEESIWGSGSCPADRIMTLHTGQQMKVWDFQKTCEAVNMGIAPIFLLCSVYSAFLILALGVKDGV